MPFDKEKAKAKIKYNPIEEVDEKFEGTKVWFNGKFVTVGELVELPIPEEERIKRDNAIYVSAILDVLYKIDVPLTKKDLSLLLKGTITTKMSQSKIYVIVRNVVGYLIEKNIIILVPLKEEGKRKNDYVFLTEYGKNNVENFITDLKKNEKAIGDIFKNKETSEK